MYNHEPKDYECPLCDAVSGKITSEKSVRPEDIVYKDDFVTAFIAGKWWPNNKGHVVIIPNEHIENLYDITQEYLHRISDVSREIALAFKETYECDGVSIRQHNEPDGNQDVFHYHMHVFPRYKDDNLYISHNDSYWVTSEDKKPYAEKLKAYFDKLKK
jgi:histidine triad (HIT) family protein